MKKRKIDTSSAALYMTHPCIIQHHAKRLMSFRVEQEPLNQRSWTYICQTDKDWNPISRTITRLKFDVPVNRQRMRIAEDCRLFHWCGRVWANVTNRDDTFLLELDTSPSFHSGWVQDCVKTRGGALLAFPFAEGSQEKNWMFFERFGTLYGIRWPHAHVVHRICPDLVMGHAVDEAMVTEYKLDWDYGRPHGGTSPVLFGNEFITLFHSHRPSMPPYRAMQGAPDREGSQGPRDYAVGVYTFDHKEPFKPTRVPTEPLIHSLNWPGHEAGFNGHNTFFPLGLVQVGTDLWNVSLGDDRDMWILEYTTDELLETTKAL